MIEKVRAVLERYLPPGTAETLSAWVMEYRIHLHIRRDRRSKAGDYRGPVPGDPRHRISINYNLNPYAFLITLVHEFAHRTAFEKYGKRVNPHGAEWKSEFQRLMQPFLNNTVFPPSVLQALSAYMVNPKASTSGDNRLVRELRQYDRHPEKGLLLEELAPGTLFNMGTDKVFRKGELQRKRYLCLCLSNKRMYLVPGIAEVFPQEPDL